MTVAPAQLGPKHGSISSALDRLSLRALRGANGELRQPSDRRRALHP
jgi:hypothetical protein